MEFTKISIVIPVYNEEENIHLLLQGIETALADWNYEIIIVDDGSTDGTRKAVTRAIHSKIKLVELYKNFGQTPAIAAGIDQAGGEIIITMDGDLQNDPEDIPHMVKILFDGDFDVVAGVRTNRKDGLILRKIPSKIANGLIRYMTGVKLHDYGCTLKVFRKEIADNLGLHGELHRFIPVLAHIQGARLTEIPVKHHPRKYGSTKYGIGRTFKVVSDLILIIFFQKYLNKPMHVFGTLGILTFLAGTAISIYLLFLKILGEEIWGRPLMILGITLILGGVQLITFGLLSELVIRIYFEARNKKPYRIRKIHEHAL